MQPERPINSGGWRHPWPWFLARGLGFFALGSGLAWVSGRRGPAWLEWSAFGLAMIGMWMLAIAWGESRRGVRAAWWRRYRTAYERNVRAAEHQSTSESSAPPPPDER